MTRTSISTVSSASDANDRLAVLWRDYHDKLHGFISSRVESPQVAQDVLQEVFIKIQGGLSTLQDSERLESWIYRIVRNAVIDHYRSRKVLEELPQTLVAAEIEEDEQARSQLSGCITPMLESLPAHYRDALMLSEIDGMKHRQVAQKLGISISAVKSRVQRGRVMLKGLLTDCCRVEQDHRGTVVGYEVKTNSDYTNCI